MPIRQTHTHGLWGSLFVCRQFHRLTSVPGGQGIAFVDDLRAISWTPRRPDLLGTRRGFFSYGSDDTIDDLHLPDPRRHRVEQRRRRQLPSRRRSRNTAQQSIVWHAHPTAKKIQHPVRIGKNAGTGLSSARIRNNIVTCHGQCGWARLKPIFRPAV